MSLNDSFKLFFLQGGQIEQKHKFNLFLKNKNWANKFEFTVLLLKSRRSKLYTQAHKYAYGSVFYHFCPYGQTKGLMVARRIFEEVKVRLLNSNNNLTTVKHGGGRIMVRVCFIGSGIGALDKVGRMIKKDDFSQILQFYHRSTNGWQKRELDDDPKHTLKHVWNG
ncbi:hypothetical protein ILYODFUR_032055 [Ilyodon furcidens]|uniref:Uncharacterized protein n=1 Tax=Ilyodon furcidens TaxID=33524 RepID=A0ABV0UPM1_9TELE